jgi:hypothetical protein
MTEIASEELGLASGNEIANWHGKWQTDYSFYGSNRKNGSVWTVGFAGADSQGAPDSGANRFQGGGDGKQG